jgi:hypothetical protein
MHTDGGVLDWVMVGSSVWVCCGWVLRAVRPFGLSGGGV